MISCKKSILRRTLVIKIKKWQKQLFGDVLRNNSLKFFFNFRGEHLCWSFFLTKLQAFRLRTSIKSVNVKDNLFKMYYFFIMRVTEENAE